MPGFAGSPACRATLLALATLLLSAVPARALEDCGSAGQPVCEEAPPPGETLNLSEAENPHGLQPLQTLPTPTTPLWPRVRGNKPFGFNAVSMGDNGTTPHDEAVLHRELGASMGRVGADWAMIQYWPQSSTRGDAWDYESYLDGKYKALIRQGIRPLFLIQRAPRRFTDAADTPTNTSVRGCGVTDACWLPPRRDALDRLDTFVRDLIKRYPLIAGVEVWNEPNISNPFWGRQTPNPEYYAEVLRTVYLAVKATRPQIPVLGGALGSVHGTTYTSEGDMRMDTRVYLRRMLQAGAAQWMDAVSHHPYLGPYPSNPDPRAQSDQLFGVMAGTDEAIRAGYANAGVPMEDRVVVTEFAASTTEGYTPEKQSYWLRMQYALWNSNHPNLSMSSKTDATLIHRAVEDPDPGYGNTFEEGFGWVKPKDAEGRFATKPVYCDFRQQFGGQTGCPSHIVPEPDPAAGP